MADFLAGDVVFVSSTNRQVGTSNDFIINLNQQITVPNNYDSITLLNASIPSSWYQITTTNQQFTLTEAKGDNLIYIPIGNYSFQSLGTTLGRLMNGHQNVYTITSNTVDQKYYFTSTGAASLTFTNASPLSLMGFSVGTYVFSNLGGTYYQASSGVVNFFTIQSILINTDLSNKNSYLGTVTPDVPSNSILNYNNQAPLWSSVPMGKRDVITARFWIVDAITGKSIDLNGLDFNFTFRIFKKNNYFQKALLEMAIDAGKEHIKQQLDS